MGHRPTFKVACALALLSSIVAAGDAAGAVTTWTINPGASSITLNIPQQQVPVPLGEQIYMVDVRTQNQSGGTWTQNVGTISGTINTKTNYNTTIEFLGGTHSIEAVSTGSFDPLPGGAAGTAPADFGVKLQGKHLLLTFNQWQDAANGAIRDIAYDIASTPLPVASGAFDSTALDVGLVSAVLDYRGIGLLGGALGSGQTILDALLENNSGAGATITPVTLSSTTASITIPVSIPISIATEDFTFTASVSGQIVATATLPSPGDANHDGVVDIFDVGVASDAWETGGPDGDVNYDGIVDIFDIGVMSDFWTDAGGGGAAAVPEPSTLMLASGVLVGLAAVGLRRWRK
jgi:hypothetical protein